MHDHAKGYGWCMRDHAEGNEWCMCDHAKGYEWCMRDHVKGNEWCVSTTMPDGNKWCMSATMAVGRGYDDEQPVESQCLLKPRRGDRWHERLRPRDCDCCYNRIPRGD